MLNKLSALISAALPSPCSYTLEPPAVASHGDYATNAAMVLGKQLGRNPREVAEEIAQKLGTGDVIAKAEVAGPGFVNVWLTDGVLLTALPTVAVPPELMKKEKIVVEYGQENIAKPLSVGHLRSNIIGQALVNIFRYLGHEVVSDNHLGDWGTQFGKVIVAYKKWGDRDTIHKNPIAELLALYVRFHEEAEADATLEDMAREESKKLEDGDSENMALWEWFNEESRTNLDRIHDRLGVHFDAVHGEAFYRNATEGIIRELLEKGIAREDDKGAVLLEFPPEMSDTPLLIRRSDGGTLYATRDLAAVKFYMEHYAPDRVLQVVGSEQSLYFRQFYDAAVRAGWMTAGQFVHVANGLVRLPEGKMSTRKGRVVVLEGVLDEAETRVRAVLDEKKCDVVGEEREQLVKDIALGAIKFSDLGHSREKNIVFTWEAALSFDGYAAPYLQYTHARCVSLLAKAGASDVGSLELPGGATLVTAEERALALKLGQFQVAVARGAAEYHPHVIAGYLFDLAQVYNSFYQSVPVNGAEGDVRLVRLYMVGKVAEVLRVGLGMLGIKAVGRM